MTTLARVPLLLWLCAGAASALASAQTARAVPNQDTVDWQLDLGVAGREAAARDRSVLVAVLDRDDPASKQMWQRVWCGARFVRHAKQDVVPVLLVFGAGGAASDLTLPFPAERLQESTWQASRALFGTGATISTPQFLLLDADGSVLAQHLGACTETVVARAIERARSDRRLSVKQRRMAQRALADRLQVEAKRSPQAAEQLAVLIRHADVETFGQVAERVVRDGEQRRAVAQWLSGQSSARVELLRSQLRLRRGCQGLIAETSPELSVRDRSVRPVFGPLPALRALPDLAGVQFVAARPRLPSEPSGRPLVMLFLLPDAADLGRQLDALRPAVRELTAEGADCLALFATLQPAAALAAIEQLDLPCPAGAYAYDAAAPLAGVTQFPASLVADELGRVVFVADQPGVRPYAEFMPTVRGLVRYQVERPSLRRANG